MATVDLFGKNIYYEIYGKGEPLLYLHGGPGASCLDCRAQAQALSESMQVILLDQYGVLRSDPIGPEETYGMELQIEMLEELRRKLGHTKWRLWGHSYGGMLSCLYAANHPHAVHKIVYECPSLYFSDTVRSIADFLKPYFISHQNSEALAQCQLLCSPDYHPKNPATKLMELLSQVQDPQIRNYLHGISYAEYSRYLDAPGIPEELWARGQRHLECLIEEGRMFDNFLHLLPHIPHPTLLITGEYDPVCSPWQTQRFLELAPDGRQTHFTASGHFPRIEEAEKFTQTLRKFLL